MAITIYRDPQSGKIISKKRAAEIGLIPASGTAVRASSAKEAVPDVQRRRARGRVIAHRHLH